MSRFVSRRVLAALLGAAVCPAAYSQSPALAELRRQHRGFLEAVEGGEVARGAHMILGDMDQLAGALKIDAPGLQAWKSQTQPIQGMTPAQIYGSLLGNWAARNKGSDPAAHQRRMQLATKLVMSGPLNVGMLADECYWLLKTVAPDRKDLVSQARDGAVALLGRDGMAPHVPPAIRIHSLKRYAALLRKDPAFAGKRQAELDKAVATLKELLAAVPEAELPPAARDELLFQASGKRRPRPPPPKPEKVPAEVPPPTRGAPPLALIDWRNTGGSSPGLAGSKLVVAFVLPAPVRADIADLGGERIRDHLVPLAARFGPAGWKVVVAVADADGAVMTRCVERWKTGLPMARMLGDITAARYDLGAYPRAAVIDAQGRLVGDGLSLSDLEKVLDYLEGSPRDPKHDGAHELAGRGAVGLRIQDGEVVRRLQDFDAAVAFQALAASPLPTKEVARRLFPREPVGEVSRVIEEEVRRFRAERPLFALNSSIKSARYSEKEARLETSARAGEVVGLGGDLVVDVEGWASWGRVALALSEDEREQIRYQFLGRPERSKLIQGGTIDLPKLTFSLTGRLVAAEARPGQRRVRLRPETAWLYSQVGERERESVRFPLK
jgi:hypothetical protein